MMNCLTLIRKGNKNYIEEHELTMELIQHSPSPWIHIKIPSRSVFMELTPNEVFSEKLIDRLQVPGKSFLVERIGDIRLLDCNVNYEFGNPLDHQLTLIFLDDKVITITTSDNILADDLEPHDFIDQKRLYDANLIILTVFRRMLDRNSGLASRMNKKVDLILKKSIAQSFEITTDELEELYARSVDLNELYEDQLTTIRLLPMNIEEDNHSTLAVLDRVEKSMAYLVNITERAQAKLDYILQRYANSLQQKANARLNTLTIVQAIFVPLTFLAGIYGMNFVRMPELEWPNGYFYALGTMAVIGIGSLILFYRNGWFKSQ